MNVCFVFWCHAVTVYYGVSFDLSVQLTRELSNAINYFIPQDQRGVDQGLAAILICSIAGLAGPEFAALCGFISFDIGWALQEIANAHNNGQCFQVSELFGTGPFFGTDGGSSCPQGAYIDSQQIF